MEQVVISGGGMAGLAMALALSEGSRTPISSVVLEQKAFIGPLFGQDDLRVLALTPASKTFLSVLGVWEALKDQACPMMGMEIFEEGASSPSLTFGGGVGEDPGYRPLAWSVPASGVLSALYEKAMSSPFITLYSGSAFDRYELGERASYGTVVLEDGRALDTRLLILAEGKASRTRENLGFEALSWSYDQKAVVATFTHTLPNRSIAFQEFFSQGPLACLPLCAYSSSLIWTVASSRAEALLALGIEEFGKALGEALRGRLGEVTVTSPRKAFPLSFSLCKQWVGPRVVCIAETAHTIHPLAGLGFNLGLKDCAVLAEGIVDAARLGADFGERSVLEAYSSRRRFDTLATGVTMDVLQGIFGLAQKPWVTARQWGLDLLDNCPFLKEITLEEAGGRGGQVPRVMRGERL